jgi:hypothetical protein
LTDILDWVKWEAEETNIWPKRKRKTKSAAPVARKIVSG